MNTKSLLVAILFILLTSIIAPITSLTTHSIQQILPVNGLREVGSLNPNQEVIFTVYIPLRNLGELYYYASAVSNPYSPLYHKFLTREQVEKMFLPVAQFNSTLSYLEQKGFHIIFTVMDSVIVAEGKVSQVEKYLGVKFAVYSNGNNTFYISYGQPKLDVYVYSSNISAILFAHPTTLITQKDIEKFSQEVNQTTPIEGYWPTVLQKVYNTTALPTQGANTTIGILDFAGDPEIYQELVYFDKVTGLPNPPNFTVVPIGPYDPNLGLASGWAGEISLDVEIAHTMAPKASIILYIANLNLPLFTAIAYIDQQDAVNVLSQSFSIAESFMPLLFNGPTFYSCVVLTDQFYALGSAEGITFLASSGDAGGSGYSSGPIGTVGYPSTSPFVTAVGGTTVYVQFPNGSYYQTAWSNYGFVPNGVNYGGSTGGISIVEPKPWYEWNLPTPLTYPYGKLVPEISANANVYPGIFIICPGNVTQITGGTSEASPLTAGILADVESYIHSEIGLLNPVLQYMAQNYYGKAIEPITYGYNIPWVAKYGFNLVTGYGTINAGYFANLFPMNLSSSSLSIVVNVYNSTTIGVAPAQQFYPGEPILITANITYNGEPVTSGTFNAIIESFMGNLSEVKLTYNPVLKLWVATTPMPLTANGVVFFYVYGKASNGIGGIGYYEAFSGFYVEFLNLYAFSPIDAELGYNLTVQVTNIYGMPIIGPTNITFSVYSYNITTNSYTYVTSFNITVIDGLGEGLLPMNLPYGDLLIIADNAYGFDPFTNGAFLQSLFVLPEVISEPGSVAPGQYVVIEGSITPPVSLAQLPTYTDLEVGSNLTAELINSDGKVVSKAFIPFSPITGVYLGYLYVPKGLQPGLYTILLFSNYSSYTLNVAIPGFFYGQIYVAPQSIVKVSSVKYAFEGQNVIIYANITNGSGEVKFGMFSATVYPSSLSYEYSTISQVVEVPLWYNPKIGLWEGNFTLPSVVNPGSLTYLAGIGYYGEPFKILVTGESALGNPTSTNGSLAYTLYVLPYSYIANEVVSDPLTYYASLVNDTFVNLQGTMINDILINDTIKNSNVTITDSNVTGLTIYGSTVTLVESTAEDIVAYNSVIYVTGGNVNGIKLVNSKIIPVNTHLANVYPALPTISITAPINATGLVNVTIKVTGADVDNVSVYLDGMLIQSFASNGTYTISLNTTKYPDGTYQLKVIAVQSDGLSSSSAVNINFENSLSTVNSELHKVESNVSNLSSTVTSISNNVTSLNNKLNSDVSSLNGTITSIDHTLSSEISSLESTISSLSSEISSLKSMVTTYGLIAIVIAIIAIIAVIVVYVMMRR